MLQFGTAKPAAGAFFDTDFAAIDSVLALALLYGLQSKGECRVAVLSVSRPNLAVANFAAAVQRYYRGGARSFAPMPPVGMATAGKPGETSPAFTAPFLRKGPDGEPVYRSEVQTLIQTADPVTLIRNYLQAQHDGNAFVVLSGPATNLAAALDYPGVRESIAAKVKHLVVTGVRGDVAAARKVFAEWPAPIVAVEDAGPALEFPGASIEKEFAGVDHPVADAYRAFRAMPYDAPSWSLAAALYAARPKETYFKLSAPGIISLDQEGRMSFTAAEKGRRHTLALDSAQRELIIQAYVELASARPAIRRRG